jgi:haloalkane dehalogenase
MAMSAGLMSREVMFPALVSGATPEFESAAAKDMHDAFLAPFKGMVDEAYNGARRFPLSIPLDSYDNGNAAAQEHHYEVLLQWDKPVHFIWGCSDDVFTEAWGREWAKRMNATFDAIPEAGHFLQNTHGKEVAKFVLAKI